MKRIFWNESSIIKSINLLRRSQVSMKESRISQDRSERTTALLKEATGYNTSGSSLYIAVTTRYKSWNLILHRVRKYSRRKSFDSRYWSKTMMIRSIRALKRKKIPLNSNSIQHNKSQKLINAIYRSTGISTNGAILMYRASKEFSSWDTAIKKAGLEPSKIRRRGISVRESGLDMHTLLNVLSNNQLKINAKAIIQNSNLIREMLYRDTGHPVSGESLYWIARKDRRSWTSVLRKAGFNPDEIVLKGKGSSLVVMPHQIEFSRDSDGYLKKSVHLGSTVKTAEEIVEIESMAEGLESATSELSSFDQSIVPRIFDLILEIDDYESQEDLTEKIAERLDSGVTAKQIQQILRKLASNKSLLAFR